MRHYLDHLKHLALRLCSYLVAALFGTVFFIWMRTGLRGAHHLPRLGRQVALVATAPARDCLWRRMHVFIEY